LSFWEIKLLKDTVFWVFFVEFPIFVKAIEKAQDKRFFRNLLKENIKITVVIAFIMNFWTFSFLMEFILVPIIILFSSVYFLSDKDKTYEKVKLLLEKLKVIAMIYVIYFVIKNLALHPLDIFTLETFKVFILPFVLLILNLPVVYGLAVHNEYEQIFILLKGSKKEHQKMMIQVIFFCGINLYKLSMLREKGVYVFIQSLNRQELKDNLTKFQRYLDVRIGDNYMRRARYYYFSCIGIIIISIIMLIYCNTEVNIKDLFKLNFIIDIAKVKSIITEICIVALVGSIFMVFLASGFKKKKYEDLTKVKKIALSKFLMLLSEQYKAVKGKDFNEIDTSKIYKYLILPACKLSEECSIIKETYDNLLSRWELESVEQLYNSANSIFYNISDNKEILKDISLHDFEALYMNKKKNAPQNEKINVFLLDMDKSIEKYISNINMCVDEFKNMLI
jgi:hypothetical protein